MSNLFLQIVFVATQTQCMHYTCHGLDLSHHLCILVPSLYFFQLLNLTTFLADLQHVHRILLLYFHHGTSQLNALVEVLEDMLLDELNFLFLIDASALVTKTINTDPGTVTPTVYARQFILVLRMLLELIASVIVESYFELLDLSMQVIDNVFVLTDMQCHKLLVGDGLGLDVLGSIGVLQCVDSLLELGAGRRYVYDHYCPTVTT